MLGPWDCSSGRNSILAEASFRVRCGAPQMRSLRKIRVILYRRTPQLNAGLRVSVIATCVASHTCCLQVL